MTTQIAYVDRTQLCEGMRLWGVEKPITAVEQGKGYTVITIGTGQERQTWTTTKEKIAVSVEKGGDALST